jgi:hypothetical protein
MVNSSSDMACRKPATVAPGGRRMVSPAKACLKIASSVSCGDNLAKSIWASGIPAFVSGASGWFYTQCGLAAKPATGFYLSVIADVIA